MRTALHFTGIVAMVAFGLLAGGPPARSAPPNIAGRVVFLDPGHNGAHVGDTVQVPAGRGARKDCQTSGTQTASGYPEHAFTWDTTLRIRAGLTALGVRSAMSRGDDASSGPCVDERAAMANKLAPDAIVSIHADGGPPSGRGFHVNYSSPPLNDVQKGAAVVLATTMRDELVKGRLPIASYIGTDGLYGRADLAGLNLAEYPAVLVELGNMRNPDEAAAMESEQGRQIYADLVVDAIAAYLSTLK